MLPPFCVCPTLRASVFHHTNRKQMGDYPLLCGFRLLIINLQQGIDNSLNNMSIEVADSLYVHLAALENLCLPLMDVMGSLQLHFVVWAQIR